VFVVVLLAVAWLRSSPVPEQRAELVSVWAFLAAAPLRGIVGAIVWLLFGKAVAGVKDWPRKRI